MAHRLETPLIHEGVSNMTGTPAAHNPFRIDVVDNMTIEWDVPIEISDGVVLSADVFRPTAFGVYIRQRRTEVD
jgi:hypothetical protein